MKNHPQSTVSSRIRPSGDFGGSFKHNGKVVEFFPTDDFKHRRAQALGTFQNMYIMADVSKHKKHGNNLEKEQEQGQEQEQDNLENQENIDRSEFIPSESETMLCMIRYEPKSGLLIVKPDFNEMKEPYDMKATTHSDSFQYRIINASLKKSPGDRDRDLHTLSLVDLQKANLLRASVGPDFEAVCGNIC